MVRFFKIHVTISNKRDGDGFSVFIMVEDNELNNIIYDVPEIIELAIYKGILDQEYAQKVDYVEEINEDEYKEWTGKEVR